MPALEKRTYNNKKYEQQKVYETFKPMKFSLRIQSLGFKAAFH